MSRNSITGLQDGLFDGLQDLENLDLSYNRISFIGLGVFSNGSDLIRLRYLDLSINELTSLEPWWYYRLIQKDIFLRIIHLSHNRISHFTNELGFNFRCNMSQQPRGYVELRFNAMTHVMDMATGWNITDVDDLKCMLKSSVVFRIDGYHYACDCVDFPVYKLAKMAPSLNLLMGVYCTAEHFKDKSGKQVLASTIPLMEFVCDISDRCPPRCRCVYRPANSTLHVYCSASNISSLPLELPPVPKIYVKYKLDFSNNKLLRRLERRPYFVNTSILDVSNCGLTDITVKDLKGVARVGVANFRGNMLQSFPRHIDSVNISARLLLGLNPWKCSCDNSWMIEWLQSLSDRISDPEDIICRSPARIRFRNVLKSTEVHFCDDPVQDTSKKTLSIVAPIFAIIAILVIISLLVHKLREKCYKRWKFHPFDRDECIGEDMDYDVFLCCSSLDHRPHAVRILELIESNGYRVCYHERDFLPGSLITNNMGQSIERSKRTVCLISNNFLQR